MVDTRKGESEAEAMCLQGIPVHDLCVLYVISPESGSNGYKNGTVGIWPVMTTFHKISGSSSNSPTPQCLPPGATEASH